MHIILYDRFDVVFNWAVLKRNKIIYNDVLSENPFFSRYNQNTG